MAVGQRIQGGDGAEAGTGLILHRDCGVRVGVHDQPDRFAGELVGHFKEAALVGYRAVFTHQALDAMLEDRIEFRGEQSQQADLREVLLVALERRTTAEAGVRGTMVAGLYPRPQACVKILQPERRSQVQLAQELGPKGSVPTFQLALSLGRVRPAINQADGESRADALQRG